MDRVVQTNQLNPARQPCCRFYVGFPGLVGDQFTYENNGFGYEDIIMKNVELDSLVFFLNPNNTNGESNFMKSVRKVNYLGGEVNIGLTSIGAQINDELSLSFDINERISARTFYPKELIQLALDGNQDRQSFSMKNLGFDFKHYREYALGLSVKQTKEWTIGFKAKVLFGKSNISTNNNIVLNTGLDEWTIPESGINVNVSIPESIAKITEDSSGKFNGIESNDEPDLKAYMMNRKNWGLALDFGAIYRMNDKFEFSASLIDMGAISWKSGTYNFSQNGSATFKGINLNPSDSTKPNPGQDIANMQDSLDLRFTTEPYATQLSTKFYLAGRYFIAEKFSFGLLSRTEFYRGRIRPSLTFSANLTDKVISTSFSYTMTHNTYSNFGWGINFKFGPFNYYFMLDNIPMNYYSMTASESAIPVLIPDSFKFFNYRFGLNLLFGCKDPNRDKPLLF